MSGAGPQPGEGHAGSGPPSHGKTVQDQEQEQYQEPCQEKVRRSGRLAGHSNTPSTPIDDTDPKCLASQENAVNGLSVDRGTGYESVVTDSTIQRPPPTRQAALRARDNFCGQSGRDTTAKRRKLVRLTSAHIEEVSWIENQVANAAAQTATRELVDDWDRIAETVFPRQGGPVSLLSRTANGPPSDELSLFIYLGGRLSRSSTEQWASTVMRRILAAHFDHLYATAIEDAKKGQNSTFFCLSDERIRQYGQSPIRKCYTGYGPSSAVRDRLIDLLFLDPEQRPQISRDQCKQRIHLIQQDGKRWRQLIQSLGYKVLFCLPPEVSDNRCVGLLYASFRSYDSRILLQDEALGSTNGPIGASLRRTAKPTR